MVCHGFADIREPVPELFDLLVQPDLVVPHRLALHDVGVEPAASDEYVLEYGLVAAVHTNVLVRHHDQLGPHLQPKGTIQAVPKYPGRWLVLPLREYATGRAGHARERVKHRHEVPQQRRVGNHVVIGEVQHLAGGLPGPGVSSEVRPLPALVDVPDREPGLSLTRLDDDLRAIS